MGKTITVKAGNGYNIMIERGILGSAGALARNVTGAETAAVVSDSNVSPLYAESIQKSFSAAGFRAPLFSFPAGEASKNHSTLLEIYSFLARSGVTRSDIVVALGGGVVGDTAGFAAATFLRGIPFVQIPTTLLAQIDSSVGGKTGVDLPEGKNLAGAFHQPCLVVCDPDALLTLPGRTFRDGMAEAIKYGCIADRGLFERLEAYTGERAELDGIIARCIEIKRDLVERDEFDRGERALLNFGHTLGHAIETCFHYKGYTHGEAVAAGMVQAALAGEKEGLTEPGTARRLTLILEKYSLPTACPGCRAELAEAAAGDKKRSGGTIGLILLKQIGAGFVHKIPVRSLDRFFFGG